MDAHSLEEEASLALEVSGVIMVTTATKDSGGDQTTRSKRDNGG